MTERELMIDALVTDDFEDIMSGSVPEYLTLILESGHKGYADYTDIELKSELFARGITPYSFEVNEGSQIVKENQK